jgi:regulator of protease activity HflC (stomatin/prohibitin superfamily)
MGNKINPQDVLPKFGKPNLRAFWVVPTLVIGGFLFLVGFTNPYTPEGHEGYVREQPRVWGNGGFQGSIKGPGNFGVSIWNNRVINVDIRPRTIQESFKILAHDDLNVSFRLQGIFRVNDNSIQQVVEQYSGPEWYKRFVKEPFRSFVRDAVRSYDSRQIKEKRMEIAQTVGKRLSDHLKETPFILMELVVGNIDYPEAVTKAVEQKMKTHQDLEKKEVEKQIAIKNAEIQIEEAKGIAKSQEIINKTLTANYLQHEAIQAQMAMANSENHTTVYIPSGTNGIPLIRTIK